MTRQWKLLSTATRVLMRSIGPIALNAWNFLGQQLDTARQAWPQPEVGEVLRKIMSPALTALNNALHIMQSQVAVYPWGSVESALCSKDVIDGLKACLGKAKEQQAEWPQLIANMTSDHGHLGAPNRGAAPSNGASSRGPPVPSNGAGVSGVNKRERGKSPLKPRNPQPAASSGGTGNSGDPKLRLFNQIMGRKIENGARDNTKPCGYFNVHGRCPKNPCNRRCGWVPPWLTAAVRAEIEAAG